MNPIRWSELKFMARSPAHYRDVVDNPETIKQTPAMRYGDALDALLFGQKPVLTFEGASRRTKAWTIFEEQNPEAVLLLPSERENVNGMLKALQSNSDAMEKLQGTTQQKLEWKIAGRACNGTPDSFKRNRVTELKTGRTAHPDHFPWDGRRMMYHAQLTWYRNGLEVTGQIDRDSECWIVAVESTRPYPVTIFELTKRAIEEGNKLWRLWFERVLVCEQSNRWPGYTEAVVPFESLL